MNFKTLQHRFKHDKGFTLIELLIVMSIILILITLAVPQYRRIKKQTNETSAVASLHTIATAEKQYNSAYPETGFACTLPAMAGDPNAGAPSAAAAQVLDQTLSSGTKAGYLFTVAACKKTPVNNQDQVTGYQIDAVPITVGSTGDRGYCMDDNDNIKFDPAGGTNCTQSLQ